MGVPRDISTSHILSVAERVFGERGYAGASMAEIARVAQLPKANIHYYFGTKEILYQAVLENTLTDWLADADRWITPAHAPRAGLRGYIAAKLAFSREHPDASRLFAHEILEGGTQIRTYLETTLRSHVQAIGQTLEEWSRSGLLPQVDSTHFMFCLWAMTQAYADMRPQMVAVLGKPELDDGDYERGAETILALVLGAHAESDIEASIHVPERRAG
ncbi:TetR/AcrR family transcriptional regulator [Tanticharoenia sakaeratensis]|jgi:TetR/AcrR family transcriptional regulator|uniref:Transcriptional regulator TetR n=1 Tax=Tanticharoenia sakaeratensis NBRC 103193 TaxID=1231623 RepID=A0A0D6MKQ7_9PROT|nr:TetR/AcrR family transcriptional regulator [Tanticharoenia sakaeratensis]GAN53848.1 transcriptional regulator TetR [Tanticharoenia sakaeratensis NBRC 103193]GBQ25070.1 TetR family transcriptional regulator [Tanticharoenia sakaeratensis NBRC 103193]